LKKEIYFKQGKVVLFKEANFWDELIERCHGGLKTIYIATYNFNFRDKYERSFYQQLSKLANTGTDVRLIYSLMSFSHGDELEIEDIFKNFVVCAKLTENHSKIFLTDEFAFIGSSNFSYGSNNNYECGVVFTDIDVIREIRHNIMGELSKKCTFTNIPQYFDPLSNNLPLLIDTVEELNKINTKEDMYIDKTRELIPIFRFLNDINKCLLNKTLKVPNSFDWLEFYGQLYEKKFISNADYYKFKNYLNELNEYLINVKTYINQQYSSIGRTEYLKKLALNN